jgi:hypothetical protein
MWGFEKNFFGPSYVQARILGPFPEARGRKKIFFWPFSPVLHQNEAISG